MADNIRRTPSRRHQRRRNEELRNAVAATDPNNVASSSMMMRRIVWVKTGSYGMFKQWDEVRRLCGLVASDTDDIVQRIGEWVEKDGVRVWTEGIVTRDGVQLGNVTVYDVGSYRDIDAILRSLPGCGYHCVLRWEYAVACSVGTRAMGMGEAVRRVPVPAPDRPSPLDLGIRRDACWAVEG